METRSAHISTEAYRELLLRRLDHGHRSLAAALDQTLEELHQLQAERERQGEREVGR